MIRDALAKAEHLGATRITIDAARDSRRVTALDATGPHAAATHVLERHTYVLTSCLARWSGEVMTITEARRRLGFTGVPYVPQTDAGALRDRDTAMAALGWPRETLTLEALREATRD